MEPSKPRIRNAFRDLLLGQLKPQDRERLYEHPSLSRKKSQIRLLEMQPGPETAPIVVTLRPVDFPADDTEPLYEALSYTWGSTEDLKRITVMVRNAVKRHRSLYVTKNCWEALSALRYEDQPRTLWVDAICINQADDVEKAQQVVKMAEIYRRAVKVTAWLGPASEDTQLAFDWIREVNTHVSLDPETNELSPLSDDSRWLQDWGAALIDRDEVCALAKLLSHPWFERVWIWQEIRLGYNRAVLKCGKFEVAWSAFCAAHRYSIGKTVRGQSNRTLISRITTYVLGLCDMRILPMLDLLDCMRSSECTDRRDKLFAVHGMVDFHSQTFIGEPDYSKHWYAVYTGLCIKLAWGRSDLNFLRFVTEHKEHGLPSWVPDWSASNSLQPIIGRAGGFSRSAVLETSSRTLRVEGQLVTTIQNVVHSTLRGIWVDKSEDTHLEELSRLLRSTLIKLGMTVDSVDTSALSYALTMGQIQEAFHPANDGHPTFEELVEVFQTLAVTPKTPSRLQNAALHVAARCWDRSLLLLANGMIALGPSNAQPGEFVSVLLGCVAPIVLRPTMRGGYHVIGPAYVSGLMEGQAFLGPLPSRHSFIWYTQRGCDYIAIRDDASGNVFPTDPRLPELSDGWQYIGRLEDPTDWAFENVKTGEKRMHGFDPRWDAVALEARGISLDTILLV